MRASGDFGCQRPGLFGLPKCRGVDLIARRIDDDAERIALARNKSCSGVDQCSHGRRSKGPDDLGARYQGPKPMGDVDELLTGKSWKEVFVASGEPYDFVGEHWANDDGHIVVEDGTVDSDTHGLIEATGGKPRYLFPTQR